MAKYKITAPDGNSYEVNAPDDASQEDVLAYAQKNFKMAATPKPSKPFGEQLNEAIGQVPRQLGLTARAGLEGVGGVLDFVSSPIRSGLNAVLPKSQSLSGLVTGAPSREAISGGSGSTLANMIGLPKPSSEWEQTANQAASMMAGAAVPIGVGRNLAQSAQGVTRGVGTVLSANPTQQIVSAGAGGAAGGYTKATGGDETSQFLASLAGSIAAPMAMNKGASMAQSGAAAVQRAMNPAPQAVQVDISINNALRDSGIRLSDIPTNVMNGIRQDVAQATRTGGELSHDAVRRLADYRLTGLTPTRATITLDPAIVSQQKNLAKLGINSKDAAAQTLGQVENANNRALVQRMNELGAPALAEEEVAGGHLAGALNNFAEQRRAEIGNLYSAARDSQGRAANLSPSHFAQGADELLGQANLNAFVPDKIRAMINRFADGSAPLNVNTAEQLKTIIGNAQRAANDGNERTALGLIRKALDETPLLNTAPAGTTGGNAVAPLGLNRGQALGQEAIDAFNNARSANRAFMGTVEQTPALESVLNGASPKGFFQRHVIAGDSDSLERTLNVLADQPQAIQQIKTQVLSYLKDKALNGAADEVGNFSQSKFNGALKMLGDRKLGMLFTPDEVSQLRALGRVASYEQYQPRGAAVNNSNTAGAGLATLLDKIGNSPLLSKIPFGTQAIGEPLQNISLSMQSKKAMDIPNALAVRQQMMEQPKGLLFSPALLGMNFEEDKKNRGLLFP